MKSFPSKRPDIQLIVRAQRLDDLEALYAMREQAGVRPNVLALPFTDPDRFRERTGPGRDGMYRLVAEAILPDGVRLLVGSLGLFQGQLSSAHRADMGIQVHEDYQEIGVGSALMAAMCDLADNWLNLHRVELEVFTDNPRGIALYKKFGFEIEATLHHYAYRNGEYVDAYFMGRINPRHLHKESKL